ncbi:MAG: gluconate 2-dehydrogenase gamma chain [Thermoleophilaceae bacterium]|nr:gluconate 2-dehydrogenase gamma chain [Thermoleophilaceae bacterium]
MPSELSRRSFLAAGGALGVLAMAPSARVRALLAEAAAGHGRFLSKHELATLRAATARFVPGPPYDPDPGAVEARVAEAIDLMLGAFRVDPPLIHAGGPFSGRAGGSGRDDFAHFVPLDRHAELGWRIRLEGSRGMREREFAGPVTGLQEIYRRGLKHLDERSRAAYVVDFADAPAPAQDAILSDQSDDRVQEFVGTAVANTIEAMYGPPEYGGNRGRVGWKPNRWPGDVQPRGFSKERVSSPDAGPNLGPAVAAAGLELLARR